MQALLNFLDGKKTYLACGVLLALLFGKWQDWWQIPEEFYAGLMALGMMFLRRGVAKGTPGQGNLDGAKPGQGNSTGGSGALPLGIWLMAFGLIAVLMLCSCAAPVYSPVPPASSWTNGIPKLQGLHELQKLHEVELPPEPETPLAARAALPRKEVFHLGPNSAAAAPVKYWLAWDYGDTTNIRFELWRASQVKGPFGYWTNVAEKSVSMPTSYPQQYFILRASNTVTHLVSDWSA